MTTATAWAAALAVGAMAAAQPPSSAAASPVILLERVGTSVTALTIVAGAVWWLIRPRVQSYIRQQTSAAAQLVPRVAEDGTPVPAPVPFQLGVVATELAKLGGQIGSVADEVTRQGAHLDRLQGQVDEIDQRVAEYLAEAAAELRLARAARVLAHLDRREDQP